MINANDSPWRFLKEEKAAILGARNPQSFHKVLRDRRAKGNQLLDGGKSVYGGVSSPIKRNIEREGVVLQVQYIEVSFLLHCPSLLPLHPHRSTHTSYP